MFKLCKSNLENVKTFFYYFSVDTVMAILPLADEYAVQPVIDKCSQCLVEMFQKPNRHPIDVQLFLECVHYAERCNLTPLLSIIPKHGTEYTIQSLKKAGIDEKISSKMKMEILEEKSKLMESFFESKCSLIKFYAIHYNV